MSETRARAGTAPAWIGTVLVVVFVFPRLLRRWPGLDSPWTSYLYLYGLGLVTFVIGLRVILSSRACQPGRGHDRFWWRVLLWGYVFFASLHAAWILAALYLPFQGGG